MVAGITITGVSITVVLVAINSQDPVLLRLATRQANVKTIPHRVASPRTSRAELQRGSFDPRGLDGGASMGYTGQKAAEKNSPENSKSRRLGKQPRIIDRVEERPRWKGVFRWPETMDAISAYFLLGLIMPSIFPFPHTCRNGCLGREQFRVLMDA